VILIDGDAYLDYETVELAALPLSSLSITGLRAIADSLNDQRRPKACNGSPVGNPARQAIAFQRDRGIPAR
jgi:hypothetical protein